MTPALLPTLRRVVDARAGIATRLYELPADPMTPELFVSAATGPNASYFIDREKAEWSNSSVGSGAAFSREKCLWATIGETVERYAASIYDKSRLITATEAELDGPAIALTDLIGFDGSTGPFSAYDASARRAWVQGRRMVDGSPIYAPAQLVYLSQEWKGTDLLAQTVSTGLACQVTTDGAALAALLELIERDGFASAWALRWAPPALTLSGAEVGRLSSYARRALASQELRISLHAAPNEFGVPVVIAFAEAPMLGFGVVGASARLDVSEAVEKAVVEVLHGWTASANARRGLERVPKLEEIKIPHDHSLYYVEPSRWESIGWFRSSRDVVEGRDLVDSARISDARDLAGALGTAGIECSVFDLTTDDVAALPLSVVRVLAPGLQPLTFGQGVYPTDRRRLGAIAARLGVEVPEDDNPQAHPFP